MRETLTFGSVPVAFLCLWAVFEAAHLWAKPRRAVVATAWWRLAAWTLRPWGVWAAINAVFRLRWDEGFNNRRTFPFFANLWNEREPLGTAAARLLRTPAVWLWGAVVVLAGVVLCFLARRALRRQEPSKASVVALLAAAYATSMILHLAIACLPEGARIGRGGSLLSSWHAHATMLYAVPLVKSSGDYVERFAELQPALRRTIHGLSHPPFGSLSLYWIGCAVGARGLDIREDTTRLRYAIGLTAVESVNAILVFLVGAALWRSRRTGLAAALLWLAAPANVLYATFAQNGFYAVCFILTLLLAWRVVTAPRWSPGGSVALGTALGFLAFVCYSWILAAAIFGAFTLATARIRGWTWGETVRRGGVPALTLLALLTVFTHATGLDYVGIYRTSREYVNQWYVFDSAYQHGMALLGGQLDILLLMGSATASAFLAALASLRKGFWRDEGTVFLLIVLCVYALPVLFGPSCLKMETARCWNWVAAVPMAFAAHRLMSQDRPGVFLHGALLVSVATSVCMRLFMNFAP